VNVFRHFEIIVVKYFVGNLNVYKNLKSIAADMTTPFSNGQCNNVFYIIIVIYYGRMAIIL